MMNSRPTQRVEAVRGPFQKVRNFVVRVVASKRFLMVISLLIAVVTWSALVASDPTLMRPKTFSNVSVGITGESTLKSRGYIIMDDLNELLAGARLTVEVTQQNYERVNSSIYNPHFDLADVKGIGENTLKMAFSSQLYGPVTFCEPSEITVHVERYMTRRIPVVLEMVGTAPEGLYLDSYRTDPAMLSVSGPQSLVTQAARAVAVLDLSVLTGDRASDRMALNVQVQNADGEPILSDKLEVTNQTVITDSVVVDTEVVPSVEIPIQKETLVSGKPAQGYVLTAIHVEREALAVAARQEILDMLSFLTAEQPLDINGATESVSGYVRLKRLSGIENTLPTEIAVTAEIQERTY